MEISTAIYIMEFLLSANADTNDTMYGVLNEGRTQALRELIKVAKRAIFVPSEGND